MYKLQERAGAIIMKDPAVATMAMGLGVGVGNSAQNTGRMFITLKPREERDVDVFQVIARLRPQLATIPGLRAYLQAAQDVHRRRPLLQNPVPVHACRTPTSKSSTPGRRRSSTQLQVPA